MTYLFLVCTNTIYTSTFVGVLHLQLILVRWLSSYLCDYNNRMGFDGCRFVWAYVLPAGSCKIQSHIGRLPSTVPLHCALAVFENFIWCIYIYIDMHCLAGLSLFSIVILKALRKHLFEVMAWFQSLTSSLLGMLDPSWSSQEGHREGLRYTDAVQTPNMIRWLQLDGHSAFQLDQHNLVFLRWWCFEEMQDH